MADWAPEPTEHPEPRDDAIIIHWSRAKGAYIYRLEQMDRESAVRVLLKVAAELERQLDAEYSVVRAWDETDEPGDMDELEGFNG